MKNKILSILLIALLVVAVLPLSAFALDYSSIYSSTPLDDLEGATIAGKDFNADNYVASSSGEISLITFSEYAYSSDMANYDVILYVYNPQQLDVDTTGGYIQLSTDSTTYTKYGITLLSSSNSDILLKFCLDSPELLAELVQSSDVRTYEVSGIEMCVDGTLTDYTVGTTYTYTGKANGIDGQEESTLECTYDVLDIIDIDGLSFTQYRTWVTQNIADQLTSVYFSVDSTYENIYDRLYSIQADTYKYLTSPVVVLYDEYIFGTNSVFVNWDNYYLELLDQVGKSSPEDGIVLGWESSTAGLVTSYGCAYNSAVGGEYNLDVLSWVFQGTNDNDYTIDSNSLYDYAINYSANRSKTVLNKYNSYLFSDYYYSSLYDLDFDGGYMDIDICADDDYSLTGSSSKLSIWDMLFGTNDTTIDDVSPIVTVTYADIQSMSNLQISSTYLIDEVDVDDFVSHVKTESAKGNTTYLFRFSQDIYYTAQVEDVPAGVVGYVSQTPVFLDFDIISLGYELEGVVDIIPCVSDPADYFSSVEPGIDVDDSGWPDWVWYVLLALAVVFLFVLISFIKPILEGVIWIIKGVVWIVRKILFGIWWVVSNFFIGFYEVLKTIFYRVPMWFIGLFRRDK